MPKAKRKRRTTPGRKPPVRGRLVQRKDSPRTAAEFFAKAARFQDQWARMTHVISKMRADGVSLANAAREFGVDPRWVLRRGSPTLKKNTNGRYTAKKSDRLLRVLFVPTEYGTREVATRDSRQASQVAEYWSAVQKYLQTGDRSKLLKFQNKHITDADGIQVRLLTDPDELDRLGSAGVLSFESLYARSA